MAQFAFKRTGDTDYPKHLKVLLQGPPKSGKHQANGTPVLTPSGWQAIETLQVGDLVIGVDGHPTAVVGVFPQGVRPMRRVITDDGGQTLAGDTHLWTILPHGNSVRTQTTDEIAKRLENNPRYAYLPMPEPIQVQDRLTGEFIPPYALGLLLGDGALSNGSVCFSKPEPSLHQALADLLPEHRVSEAFEDGKTVRISGLRSKIEALGLGVRSEEKFIPEQYLWTSVENRLALLAGLLDTDGGMNGKSTAFYTSSERLSTDVVALVRSLGGVATVKVKPTPQYTYLGERLIGKPVYNISIRLPRELGCPFRLTVKALAWENGTVKRAPSRRIVRIEPVTDVESTCIAVANEDGLYVTEDYIVTHNTTFIATAPNVVVAAVEAGLMSIAHKDIPYVEIDGTDKLQTLQMVLNDPALRANAAANLGLPDIETVAIDTLDAWQELLKKEIMKENRRTQMQRDDWGTLKERMAAVMKAFVALPVNVIFTVHTTTSQDEDSRLIYTPNLQGSIKDDVAGYVDFSLLAFRQREVDAQGQPTIAYYLKNEGDLKNPSLGNRAAGRVPEICLPNFQTLYDAVFNGIRRADPSQSPTEITSAKSAPVAQPVTPAPAPAKVAAPPIADAVQEEAAQKLSQVVAPVPAEVTTPGVPVDDSANPINASGIAMLTKLYLSQSMVLPEDVKSWTLGKGRQVAKYFVGWNTDKAAGRNPTRDDLVEYLQAVEAWAGEIPGIQTGVDNVATPPKPEKEPAKEVATADPAAEETSTAAASEPAAAPDAMEAATQLIQTQLGGVQIGHQVLKGAQCEQCGNPVDDLDIANLGVTRFKQVLCVKDYKAAGAVKAGAVATI